MAMEYASLEPGQTISDTEFEMDASSVSAYVDAVGDESGIFDPDDPRSPVPPMAIAAQSLRSVLDELAIQPGTLHAGQEIEFIDAVEVGEKLSCRATVGQNSVRGEWRFLIIDLSANDGSGHAVMSGKSTLMVPAAAS